VSSTVSREKRDDSTLWAATGEPHHNCGIDWPCITSLRLNVGTSSANCYSTARCTFELKPHPPSMAIPSSTIDAPHRQPIACLADLELVAAIGVRESSHEPCAPGEHTGTVVPSGTMDGLCAGTALRADPEQLLTCVSSPANTTALIPRTPTHTYEHRGLSCDVQFR
jgi:hypothetical protein